MTDLHKRPVVSVLIEGYNDSLDLGSALETVKSITDQTYCLEQVEIILTGSEAQAARWREALAGERRFFAVKVIGADAHYYRLKNLAAEAANLNDEFPGVIADVEIRHDRALVLLP